MRVKLNITPVQYVLSLAADVIPSLTSNKKYLSRGILCAMEIISSSTVVTNQTTRIFFCNKPIKVYFRPPYLKHVFVTSHFLKFNVVRKTNACPRVCSSLVSMVTFFMFLLGLLMYITFEPTKVLLLQSQKCNTECKLIFENTYSAEIIVLNCLHIPVPY